MQSTKTSSFPLQAVGWQCWGVLRVGLGDHPAVVKLVVDLNWGGGKKAPNQ